jgi:hypothetical protein
MQQGDDAMTSTEARLLAAGIMELKSDVGDMRLSLQGMQRAMEALVRIDEQQINMRSSIGRAFDEVREERQKREALDSRLHLLEVDAPSYKELRRWVVGGVLTGVAMLAAALLKVVVLDPVSAAYLVQRPAAIIQPDHK